ncbi:MAG: hypothetical protein GXP48_10085 [Acidobacteria bacterium]|nr:hypothetical protein [Acidobacteriota bacterium]
MSRYRVILVAFTIALVLPLWQADAGAAQCPYVGPAPHQCSRAVEVTTGCFEAPLPRNGAVERFFECHCGNGPVPSALADSPRLVLSGFQGLTVVTAESWVPLDSQAPSTPGEAASSSSPDPPGPSFVLNCAYLI